MHVLHTNASIPAPPRRSTYYYDCYYYYYVSLIKFYAQHHQVVRAVFSESTNPGK